MAENKKTATKTQFWLFKSEPNTWSWDDQCARGTKGEHWDGVRNFLANKNMKAMAVGDRGFFYHSVNEKRIMGSVQVIREHYPDHTDPKGRFGMVDIIGRIPCAFFPKLSETSCWYHLKRSFEFGS